MDDNEALLWDKSRRKRDMDERNKETDEEKLPVDALKEGDKRTENPGQSSTSVGYRKDIDIAKLELTKQQVQKDIDNEVIFTNEEIHEKLRLVDPKMAERLHPNNRRKILR